MLPFKFLEGFLYVYCESLFGNFNKIVSVLSWSHCVLGSYSGHEQLGALESPEIRGKILCSCGYIMSTLTGSHMFLWEEDLCLLHTYQRDCDTLINPLPPKRG